MKIKNKKRGFTLVELLVVIAIIGILAAVVVPNAMTAVEKSKVKKTIADMKSLKTAVLMFYSDLGFFPADVVNGVDPGLGEKPPTSNYSFPSAASGYPYQDLTSYVNAVVNSGKWQGPYLDFPLSKKTAWNGEYDYECWAEGIGVQPPYSDYVIVGKRYGIYITIHGVPEKSAKRLVEESPFEVVTGEFKDDDIGSYSSKGLKKVVLKIADWPYSK